MLRHPKTVLALAASSLLAAALWGVALEDVRRWVPLGPLQIHVGFLVLPLALAAMARVGGLAASIGAIALSGALVLQPDAGSATAFALGVAGLAVVAGGRARALGVVATLGAAAVAWTRPDPLAPVRFVEGVAALAGAQSLVLGGAAYLALIAPAAVLGLAAWRKPALARGAAPAALLWLGFAGVSLIAHFPTPILGGGVSPIVGYAVTWGLLAGFHPKNGEG